MVANSWTRLCNYTHTQPDGIAQRLSICLEGHVLPTMESKWNLEFSRNEDPFDRMWFTLPCLAGKTERSGPREFLITLFLSISVKPLLATGSRPPTCQWRVVTSPGEGVLIKALADAPFLNLGNNAEPWAKDLHKKNFELLCKDGTRKPVDEAESCYLARAPNHAVVSRKDKATCVERILNAQQVRTSQGVQTVFLVWIWIIGGFRRRGEAHTHSCILSLEVRTGKVWMVD